MNLPIFIVFETVVVEPVVRNLLEYQDLQRHIYFSRWERNTDLEREKWQGGGEEYLKMKFKTVGEYSHEPKCILKISVLEG